MERTEILQMPATLKLAGMRAAYDEIVARATKRQFAPAQVIGELVKAEIAEKRARSIRYQIGARLPLAREPTRFVFDGTPVNAAPCLRRGRRWCSISPAAPPWRSSATRCWSAAPAPARAIWRWRSRAALIASSALKPRRRTGALLYGHRPGQPARDGGAHRTARAHRRPPHPARPRGARRTRLPAVRPLCSSGAGGQRLFHLASRLYERSTYTSTAPGHHQPGLRRMADRLRGREDDHGAARPSDPSLRYHRDRQREPALQAPRLIGPLVARPGVTRVS
jgi:hypothetical protein